jgi:hypothetical protein
MMNTTKKIATGILAAAMLTSSIAFGVTANAAEKKTDDTNPTNSTVITKYIDPEYGALGAAISIEDVVGKEVSVDDVKNVEADTKDITTLLLDDYEPIYEGATIVVSPEEDFKGTSTITFDVDDKTYNATYIALDYENPASTFKVDGENFKEEFDTSTMIHTEFESTIERSVNIKAAKGWKITNVSAYGYDVFDEDMDKTSYKADLEDFMYLQVTFQNDHTGAEIQLMMTNDDF